MARAILEEDVIVKIVLQGGVDIGPLPKNVGLERLRFDGEKIVDLFTLSAVWVRFESRGVFSFHAIQVPNSQLVNMSWVDRKKLHVVNGVIEIRDPQDVQNEMEILQALYDSKNMNLRMLLLIENLITALGDSGTIVPDDFTEKSKNTILLIRQLKNKLG